VSEERPFKLYVFDADGTLRRTTVPGLTCPNRPGDWELIPGVRERLSRIGWGEGGLGYLTLAAARGLLVEMVVEAFGVEPPPGAIEICPHAPHWGCACRKPEPEMLLRLMRRFRAEPEETLYVGDMDRDEGAARAAGTSFMWAHEFFGWTDAPST
jgi:D-glycero-D-manno-heptose 1,7-bisphosphate phosphatase